MHDNQWNITRYQLPTKRPIELIDNSHVCPICHKIHSRAIRILWGLIGLLVFIFVHRNLKQKNVCEFKPFHKMSGDVHRHRNCNMEDKLMGSSLTCHSVSTIAMSKTRTFSTSWYTDTCILWGHSSNAGTMEANSTAATRPDHSEAKKPPLFTTSG